MTYSSIQLLHVALTSNKRAVLRKCGTLDGVDYTTVCY